MISFKEQFLKEQALNKFKSIDPHTKAKWGVMSVHHMIEHMTDAFRMANGSDVYTGILTPPEKIERVQQFVIGDVPFKENTKNALLPETPLPIRNPDIQISLQELQKEIDQFFHVFEEDKTKTIRNPFFGDLDYEHWISLLHKHTIHHLNQFDSL